jgi:sugar lactone lactonase YvrE
MKKLNTLMYFFIIFFFSLSFLYSQKVETKDGVRIIHNEKGGKWGKDLKVSLQLIRTLGGIDVEDENLAFHSPEDMVMDAEEKIYILDSGNHRIQIFSPKGKYLRTIGRLGQGPGEFRQPLSIDIDSSGYLYVLGRWNNRIQVLTPEGKAYKTALLISDHSGKVRCVKPGLVAMGGITGIAWVRAKEMKYPKLMQVLDLEGNVKQEFGEMLEFGNKLGTWWANWLYFDVDREGYFYFSFMRQNRVEKYSPEGRLLWRAERVLNYSMRLQDEHGVFFGGIGKAPGPPQASSGIAVDEKGRVWVVTLNRQLKKEEQSSTTTSERGVIGRKKGQEVKKMDIYKLEIFDPDGILLGEIPLDHIAHGLRIQKNFLLIKDMENCKFYQYKIIEK